MKIDLTELLRKVGNEADVEVTEKMSFPEDGLTLTKPVNINLHLVNTGASVVLDGGAETEAELDCSRCLKKFQLPLKVEFSEEFARNPYLPRHGGETELKEEDFVSAIEKNNSIDLTDLVRQELLLSLPIKTLCRENCKDPR